jgi:hypothetical protein
VYGNFLRLALSATAFFSAASAQADIPAGYAGKPFDPAVAGGVGIIPTTVKAGPYSIPGRLDFVNYDMGGEMVAFHAGDHILDKAGHGYRTDMPVPTFSKTSMTEGDVWYDNGTALDGTPYPSATTSDFYIGAVQVGDWFNFTVNVQTAGTYTLSSTWSSGNGPPGGEGGDGSMGLEVFVNDTKVATWTAEFPNYQTTTNFHNWKSYPSFATITLEAGAWLIKLQSTSKHLNLDYVDFELAGADGGLDNGDSSSSGSPGGSGSAGTSGSSGTGGSGTLATSGATPTSGSISASGAVAISGSMSSSGATPATSGDNTSTGNASASTAGGGSSGTSSEASGSSPAPGGTVAPAGGSHSTGCAVLPAKRPLAGGAAIGVLVGLFFTGLARRRTRSS